MSIKLRSVVFEMVPEDHVNDMKKVRTGRQFNTDDNELTRNLTAELRGPINSFKMKENTMRKMFAFEPFNLEKALGGHRVLTARGLRHHLRRLSQDRPELHDRRIAGQPGLQGRCGQ
jgi:hypothetical protein